MERIVNTALVALLVGVNCLLPAGMPSFVEICSAPESMGVCECGSDCCLPAPGVDAGTLAVRESPCCTGLELTPIHTLDPATGKTPTFMPVPRSGATAIFASPRHLTADVNLLKEEAAGRSRARPPDIPLLHSSLLI